MLLENGAGPGESFGATDDIAPFIRLLEIALRARESVVFRLFRIEATLGCEPGAERDDVRDDAIHRRVETAVRIFPMTRPALPSFLARMLSRTSKFRPKVVLATK